METFSALLALCEGNSPVTSEFPSQRPVTRRFDVFFDLRLNKRSLKQSRRRWFETASRPLWRHCNVTSNNVRRNDNNVFSSDCVCGCREPNSICALQSRCWPSLCRRQSSPEPRHLPQYDGGSEICWRDHDDELSAFFFAVILFYACYPLFVMTSLRVCYSQVISNIAQRLI